MKSYPSLPSYSPFLPFSYDNPDRDRDIYLSLNGRCISMESFSFMESILVSLRKEQGWVYHSENLKNALGAFLFDILRLMSISPEAWLWRSFRPKSFSREYVGYKPFKRLFDGMRNANLLVVKDGYFVRDANGEGSGNSTRVRPTQELLSLLASYGITPSNYRLHFSPITGLVVVSDPVRVRAAKSGDYMNPHKGRLLPVNLTNPKVADDIARIERLNAFLSEHAYDGCTFEGLYRLYNLGDRPDFDFNKGGRLYTLGDYQRIKREQRHHILINGEKAAEVDVAGSHLTIMHASLGAPLHPAFDPYDVPGIPRAVVKSFIVMTLGNGAFQSRWSRPIAAEYLEENRVRLQDAYPIAGAREAILDRLPTLRKWPDGGLTWADLQYRESLGLIAAIEVLADKYGIPALPLHDSLIVPVSKRGIVEKVMKDAFLEHAGVRIRVNIK